MTENEILFEQYNITGYSLDIGTDSGGDVGNDLDEETKGDNRDQD